MKSDGLCWLSFLCSFILGIWDSDVPSLLLLLVSCRSIRTSNEVALCFIVRFARRNHRVSAGDNRVQFWACDLAHPSEVLISEQVQHGIRLSFAYGLVPWNCQRLFQKRSPRKDYSGSMSGWPAQNGPWATFLDSQGDVVQQEVILNLFYV